MSDEHDDTDEGQPDEQEASVLPAREAMSLITPDASAGFMPDMGAVEGATPDAGQAVQGAAGDAQGSESGQESTTSEDRSEHISSQVTSS